MDIPWQVIGLTSIAGSFVAVNLSPQYYVMTSYIWNFLILLLLQATAVFLWQAILYPKLFSPLRHLPTPSGGTFLNGHFAIIAKEPTGTPHRRWLNEVPNDGLIYYRALLNQERLLITSPQALSEVLTLKSYDFIKPQMVRNGLSRILGVGVLLAEGDEHKRQRKLLMPAFQYRHIKDLYPVFWSKSCKLVDKLMNVAQESEKPVQTLSEAVHIEIGGWSSRAALDIIGVAGMGQDFNALDDPTTELNATYRKVFQPTRSGQILGLMSMFLPQWFLRSLPVAHNSNIVEASAAIKKICRQLIRSKQDKLDRKEERVDVDILSVAIESGGFSEEDLVNQMMTFLAAGHETTATTMTWAFYELCRNPLIQTRLRDEIRAHIPSPATDPDSLLSISAATFDSCPYLHAVCNEVLRLWSPVPMTLRETAKSTTILSQPVPKGTKIIISPWATNTATQYWGPDAADFNPDRWMGPGKANTGGAESNYSFLTFLHGPRSCIGQAFAKAEFACLLAAVVGRFEFEFVDELLGEVGKLEIKGGITAKPKRGVEVKLRAVEGW